ncbi:hypothetical protein H0W91_02685 [Patescibacteria group bacterium]|nr:hypothetical protein [Patescibacteria group bacterium]
MTDGKEYVLLGILSAEGVFWLIQMIRAIVQLPRNNGYGNGPDEFTQKWLSPVIALSASIFMGYDIPMLIWILALSLRIGVIATYKHRDLQNKKLILQNWR